MSFKPYNPNEPDKLKSNRAEKILKLVMIIATVIAIAIALGMSAAYISMINTVAP